MLRYLSNRLAATAAILTMTANFSAVADEPVAEFLQGLRERRYFDTALEYLSELEQRRDLPESFAVTIEFERGRAFRDLGRASRIAADRETALQQAETAFRKFASTHQDRPQAADANYELGQLIFERARTLNWELDSSNGSQSAEQGRQQVRIVIGQARDAFATALRQCNTQLAAMPRFVDESEDKETFDRKSAVEVRQLLTQFSLARCTYEEAQTHPSDSRDFKRLLSEASTEFENIYTTWRQNAIGLQARLMMGQCLQLQGDLDRAMGIYSETLSQTSELSRVRLLKSTALQYRLACLNHDSRKEFSLAVQEADQWLQDKSNRELIYHETGLGILWEKAVAQEKLAANSDRSSPQKAVLLRQALADAKQTARFPGPHQNSATQLAAQLRDSLGEKEQEPRDFGTAFERARTLIGELQQLQKDADTAASPDQQQTARQTLEGQLNEIGRLFQLALKLRGPETDAKAVAQARYLLSYVYMRQRKNLDAIILAEYCITRDQTHDPESAQSATDIAINAAIQALNDAPADDRQFEAKLLKDVCELIVRQYPQSDRGNEARVRLGQVYRDLDMPLRAAEVYLDVPPDYSGYASARIQAGQSYWLAWAAAADDKSSVESGQVQRWKTDARRLLLEGLQAAGDEIQRKSEFTAAQVTMAAIHNIDGQFDETIQRLTAGGDASVLSRIQVQKGESRPDSGITSATFAAQTYRLLLRAYVGAQDIDNALNTMAQLEAVGGQDVADVYTQLGRELQQELQRLRNDGSQARLIEVRESFEQFLSKVSQQRDRTDFSSLLWIGETYFGLGRDADEGSSAAVRYFEQAGEAYQDILDNQLADEATLLAVQLRVVRCLRAQHKYAEGFQQVQDVLLKNEQSLDFQFEAAHLLADWGAGPGGPPEKLLRLHRRCGGECLGMEKNRGPTRKASEFFCPR